MVQYNPSGPGDPTTLQAAAGHEQNGVLQPIDLTAFSTQQADNTFAIKLVWVNPVNYDKIIVSWGPGSTPDAPAPASFEPPKDNDNAAETYTIFGCPPATSFVFKVQGGNDKIDGTTLGGVNYSSLTSLVVQIPLLGTSGATGVFPQLLLYNNASGQASTAAIRSGTDLDHPQSIGAWDNTSTPPGHPWSQLVPFTFDGAQFLLLYKQATGEVFSGELANDLTTGLSSLNQVVPFDGFEEDWAQIVSVVVGGTPFLFFYSAPPRSKFDPLPHNPGPGRYFFAPLLSSTTIGTTTSVSVGEGALADLTWSIITSFVAPDGSPNLLFYTEETGQTFTAPINPGPKVGDLTQIGTWDHISSPDGPWSQLASFTTGGVPFLLLYKRKNGILFSIQILPENNFGEIATVGGWAPDSEWTHIGPFNP